MKICLASNNQGKIAEFNQALKRFHYEMIPQSMLDIPDVEETETTFVGNALLKANHAREYTDLPVLADDSGLAVDALGGRPGIYSARYAGKGSSSETKIHTLLEELKAVPESERTARYHCVLVLLGLTENPIICEATWEGRILFAPEGKEGFGYDPIFFIPEKQRTAAELTPEEKNQISHRGQAIKKLTSTLIMLESSHVVR